MADYQIRHSESQAAREIKASAHYAYVVNGITLDGSKFSAEELVLEGQCLARNISTGKYEKYADDGTGEWPEGYDSPVILDESVKFKLDDDGNNADQVAGQVLVHGAVYESMLFNCTDAFKARLAGAIRFV